MKQKYWICIIGPVDSDLLSVSGADAPPRQAARNAITAMTGLDPMCNSGWCDQAEYDRVIRARYSTD